MQGGASKGGGGEGGEDLLTWTKLSKRSRGNHLANQRSKHVITIGHGLCYISSPIFGGLCNKKSINLNRLFSPLMFE